MISYMSDRNEASITVCEIFAKNSMSMVTRQNLVCAKFSILRLFDQNVPNGFFHAYLKDFSHVSSIRALKTRKKQVQGFPLSKMVKKSQCKTSYINKIFYGMFGMYFFAQISLLDFLSWCFYGIRHEEGLWTG